MKLLKGLWMLFALPARLVWWPFGLFLNKYVEAIWRGVRDALRARSGEDGKRRREAQRHAASMLSEFNRLGFTRVIQLKKNKKKRQRVRFDYPLLMTKEELWCPISLPKLPTGVKTVDLTDEAILKSLEDRLNAPVRPDYLSNGKLCFVVRLGGTAFPEKYSINKVKIPDEAPLLTVPFGIDSNGEDVLLDLLDLKHLLIAGATGNGKTVLNHSIITTIINRNRVEDVELRLIDMKRAEFGLYRPLLGKRGQEGIVRTIAVDAEEAVALLDDTLREIDRRNKLLDQHNAVNLSDLALTTGMHLKRIVLIIEEFPQLTLNTDRYGNSSIGKASESLITRIASLGRSSGVSIIIATQMINAKVMSGMIKANFENRLCLNTAGWRESHMVIESSEADGLPVGRAILRAEGKTKMVQTCFIAPAQVRLEINRIAQFGPEGSWGGDFELHALVKDAKLILEAACTHFAGEMARSKILALPGVKGAITQDRFNEVAARLERDGIVESGARGKARRVAKAFFNRYQMLDSFYGLEVVGTEQTTIPSEPTPTNQPQTNTTTDQTWFENTDLVSPQQDATNPEQAHEPNLVLGLETSATPPPHEADPDDPEMPAWFGRTFEQAPAALADAPAPMSEEPVQLAKPKKPRAPRKPKAPPMPPPQDE